MPEAITHGPSQIVSILDEQHQQLETLTEHVLAPEGQDRQTAFHHVLHLLAAHKAAEEAVLHRLAGSGLGVDDSVVLQRLAAEEAVNKTIAGLEQFDVDSREFADGVATLQKSVSVHAAAKEGKELRAAVGVLDAEQQSESIAALTQVPSIALSHALQVNSFAAMLHAARDYFGSEPGI